MPTTTFTAQDSLHAQHLAHSWHINQEYNHQPYTTHLYQVAEIAQLPYSSSLNLILFIFALLHDILEDTNITLLHFQQCFGASKGWLIYRLLRIISDPSLVVIPTAGNISSKPSRKQRKEIALHKLAHPPLFLPKKFVILIIRVKLADRIANTSSSKLNKPSLYKTYCKELPHLLQAISWCQHHPLIKPLVDTLQAL